MDVSFVKDTNKAVASIVNIEYPSLEIKEFEMIQRAKSGLHPNFLKFSLLMAMASYTEDNVV